MSTQEYSTADREALLEQAARAEMLAAVGLRDGDTSKAWHLLDAAEAFRELQRSEDVERVLGTFKRALGLASVAGTEEEADGEPKSEPSEAGDHGAGPTADDR